MVWGMLLWHAAVAAAYLACRVASRIVWRIAPCLLARPVPAALWAIQLQAQLLLRLREQEHEGLRVRLAVLLQPPQLPPPPPCN